MDYFLLTGKITSKVELKSADKKGKKIEYAYFTVLTDSRYKDKRGYFQRIWSWYNDARDLCQKHLKEGDHVRIEGYHSQNKQKEIVFNATSVHLVSRPGTVQTDNVEVQTNEKSEKNSEDENPLESEELTY